MVIHLSNNFEPLKTVYVVGQYDFQDTAVWYKACISWYSAHIVQLENWM